MMPSNSSPRNPLRSPRLRVSILPPNFVDKMTGHSTS
jgi:hypothetical protein